MPRLPFTRRPLRQARRYQAIISVLVKHGFSDVLHRVGLARFARHAGLASSRASGQADATVEERLRHTLEDLGPTFIKLGQVLSTRRDLVPSSFADEFSRLQNQVPQVPFELIDKRLRLEFGSRYDDLIAHVEPKPLAAGSMAQAHRARTRDGREIVLKVLRPGIEDVIESDMEALRFLASLVEDGFQNLGFKPVAVTEEFARELAREVDFEQEARSTEALRLAFEDDADVRFPCVSWELTTSRVLGVELIRGRALADVEPADLAPEVREAIVRAGARSVLRQTLELGFFHADPHPGNLFIDEDDRLVFIDCGMTGHVDPETRLRVAEVVRGVVEDDPESVIECALAISDADPARIDMRRARADVQDLISRFVGVPLERIHLADLLDRFFAILRRHHMTCPADLVLLLKALSTIEGVGARFDPSFDMIEFARPHIERLIRERYSPQAVAGRLRDASLSYFQLVERLPGDVAQLLDRVRRDRLRFTVELRSIEELTETVESATDHVAYALVIAAIIVASALVIQSAPSDRWSVIGVLGIAGLLTASLLGLGLVYSTWRARKTVRRRTKQARRRRADRSGT